MKRDAVKIAIIGQGGHSKVIRDLIAFNNNQQIVAFLDDKNAKIIDEGRYFFWSNIIG